MTDETKDKDKEDKTDESTVNSDKPEGAEEGNEKESEDFDEEEEEEDVADKLMKICEGDKTNGIIFKIFEHDISLETSLCSFHDFQLFEPRFQEFK